MSRPALVRWVLTALGAFALLLVTERARADGAGPRPLWSFHAGAPLSGAPGVGADGTLVVGTVDGYVHALAADGVFRFSYTVNGRVLGTPLVLGDGLVLVATDTSRLYALNPDGSHAWWRFIAGGVASELAPDDRGRVWLRTGSGTTIAVSHRGGVVGFAKIGHAMTLGPVPLADGGVIVADPAGELGLIGDFGKFRKVSVAPLAGLWPLASGFLALAPSQREAELGQNELSRFKSDLEHIWMRIRVDRLFCTWPIVTLEAHEIRWIDNGGDITARVAAPSTLTDPSVCTESSLFAVGERGGILQIRKNGERMRIDAPSGAIIALHASPGALVVAYRDGRVVALKVAP